MVSCHEGTTVPYYPQGMRYICQHRTPDALSVHRRRAYPQHSQQQLYLVLEWHYRYLVQELPVRQPWMNGSASHSASPTASGIFQVATGTPQGDYSSV